MLGELLRFQGAHKVSHFIRDLACGMFSSIYLVLIFPSRFWIPTGRLMALEEAALPYALRVMCDGMVEAMGKATFEGDMKSPFTAHPKKDPAIGKL